MSDYFRAYETGYRSVIDRLLAEDFTVTSPFDETIRREHYFRRCWPNNCNHRHFDIEFLAQDGDRVLVVYVANIATENPVHPAARFRSAECHAFAQGETAASHRIFRRSAWRVDP